MICTSRRIISHKVVKNWTPIVLTMAGDDVPLFLNTDFLCAYFPTIAEDVTSVVASVFLLRSVSSTILYEPQTGESRDCRD